MDVESIMLKENPNSKKNPHVLLYVNLLAYDGTCSYVKRWDSLKPGEETKRGSHQVVRKGRLWAKDTRSQQRIKA